jgi:hypothetical protein
MNPSWASERMSCDSNSYPRAQATGNLALPLRAAGVMYKYDYLETNLINWTNILVHQWRIPMEANAGRPGCQTVWAWVDGVGKQHFPSSLRFFTFYYYSRAELY